MKLSFAKLFCSTAMMAGLTTLHAQSILVPNGSFESQSGAGQPFGVNINIDSWQKLERPGYFPEEGFGGLYWVQTAGVFVDSNPYVNRDGVQAGYIMAFPSAGIYQELGATYQPGSSYDFALGVYGKNMADGHFLQLSFFYTEGTNRVMVGTPASVFYSEAAFPTNTPPSLTDFHVTIPEVQSGDAWANKNIGLKIEAVFGPGYPGYWDFDNARLLTTVPEPSTIALVAIGLGGLAAARLRRCK